VIWALIPARGGSKGLPRKHLLPLRGKPLLAHTIEAARAAGRIVVSTDDAEIARVARDWGAEVFDRPAHLATDTASVRDALFHTLDGLVAREGRPPDAFAILFATSPWRPPGMFEALSRKLENAFVAWAVTRVPDLPAMRRLDTGERVPPMRNLTKSLGLGQAMRYAPPGCRPFESRGRWLRWARERGVPTAMSFLEIDDPRCLLDVDTREDLEGAERAL
jgi:GTP:adenosylcobinamide-phosphate guanylyltransferase